MPSPLARGATRRFGERVFVPPAELVQTAASSSAKPGASAPFRFVDVRYALADPRGYGRTEHRRLRPAPVAGLPTAFICTESELSAPATATTGRHPIAAAADFIGLVQSRFGVGLTGTPARDPALVCFDDKSGAMAAARCWFMLNDLGIEAYIMRDGVQGWAAAGGPVESGEPITASTTVAAADASTTPTWPYAREWSPRVVTDLDAIDPAAYVDARAQTRFDSTVRPLALDKLPGHLKGSACLPFMAHYADGATMSTLKPDDELRANFEQRALSGDLGERVFGCASGVTACFNIAVSTHLGLGMPRLYPGSWSQIEAVRRDALRADVLSRYGVIVTCVKNANAAALKGPANPPCDVASATITCEDQPEFPRTDTERKAVATVVTALHPGETAEAETTEGCTFTVTVPAPTA